MTGFAAGKVRYNFVKSPLVAAVGGTWIKFRCPGLSSLQRCRRVVCRRCGEGQYEKVDLFVDKAGRFTQELRSKRLASLAQMTDVTAVRAKISSETWH